MHPLTYFGLLAASLLLVLYDLVIAPVSSSGNQGPNENLDPDDAAKQRDEDFFKQLGELISACPTCDRVLAEDEVWHHAASWMSLKGDLPRSSEPCPNCRKIQDSV